MDVWQAVCIKNTCAWTYVWNVPVVLQRTYVRTYWNFFFLTSETDNYAHVQVDLHTHVAIYNTEMAEEVLLVFRDRRCSSDPQVEYQHILDAVKETFDDVLSSGEGWTQRGIIYKPTTKCGV